MTVDQQLDGVPFPSASGHHQCCFSMRQNRSIRIGASFDESFHHWGAAVHCPKEHWRCAVAIYRFCVSAGVDKRVGHFEVIPTGSPVQGGGSVGLSGVDIGLLLQQGLDGHCVLVHGCVGDIAVRCRETHRGRDTEAEKCQSFHNDNGSVLSP